MLIFTLHSGGCRSPTPSPSYRNRNSLVNPQFTAILALHCSATDCIGSLEQEGTDLLFAFQEQQDLTHS